MDWIYLAEVGTSDELYNYCNETSGSLKEGNGLTAVGLSTMYSLKLNGIVLYTFSSYIFSCGF